jgi:hypothetical protein
MLGLAAGSKGLDDDHTSAAARTGVPLAVLVRIVGAVAVSARWGWVGCAEEPTGQCDIGDPVAVGEEAVVADAVSAKIAIAIIRNCP